jgi:type IV secretory pathway TraG/TraD family ATPase VirD4
MRDSTKYYWWSGFWAVLAVFFYISILMYNDFYLQVYAFVVCSYSVIAFNIMICMAGHLKKYHEGRWRKDIQ